VVTQCFSEGSIGVYDTQYESTSDFTDLYTARVDYCYNETFGGICDIGWDDADAEVVCRYIYGEGYCKYIALL